MISTEKEEKWLQEWVNDPANEGTTDLTKREFDSFEVEMIMNIYKSSPSNNTKLSAEEIRKVSIEIADNVIEEMQMPTFISGEEIEHIENGINKLLSNPPQLKDNKGSAEGVNKKRQEIMEMFWARTQGMTLDEISIWLDGYNSQTNTTESLVKQESVTEECNCSVCKKQKFDTTFMGICENVRSNLKNYSPISVRESISSTIYAMFEACPDYKVETIIQQSNAAAQAILEQHILSFSEEDLRGAFNAGYDFTTLTKDGGKGISFDEWLLEKLSLTKEQEK